MKRIMIVDDEPDVVELLSEIISGEKYRVIKAHNGNECLQLASTTKPDLILLDILMEPMDGWETLDRLKKEVRTKQIPVIVLTAKQIEIDDAIKRAKYVADYVTKPVDGYQIKNAIEEVFDLDTRIQKILEQAKKSKINPQAIAEIESKFIPALRNYSVHKKLYTMLKQIYTESRMKKDEELRKAMDYLQKEIEKMEQEVEKISSEFKDLEEKMILSKIEEYFKKRPSSIEKFLLLLQQQPSSYKLNLERVLILLFLKDGERRRLSEIRANLNEKMEISDRLTLYYLEDLMKSGLVLKEPHSMYKITDKGQEIANKYDRI